MNQKEKIRLNFDMSPAVAERLERLKAVTDSDSKKIVIQRALAVYDHLWTEKGNGHTLILRDGDGNESKLVLL